MSRLPKLLTVAGMVLIVSLLMGSRSSPWTSAILPLGGLAQAAPAGPVRAATTPPFAPWQYRDQSGRLTGFEVEILREIGRRLNREVEFVDVQWEGALAGLMANRYDVVASAVGVTCERQKIIDFSVPYYEFGVSIAVRKDDRRIQRVEDLKGMVVGVGGGGSTSHLWLTENRSRYEIGDVRVYENNAAAMLDLAASRIDAVAQNYPSQLYYIRDKPNFEIRLRSLTSGFTAMAFRKGEPLVSPLNGAIDAMKRDGTMARFHREQFGSEPPADSLATRVVPPVPIQTNC
ncbi:MAG: substrate-binding periplasmic protein [Gammaproteobacteria bacterium]